MCLSLQDPDASRGVHCSSCTLHKLCARGSVVIRLMAPAWCRASSVYGVCWVACMHASCQRPHKWCVCLVRTASVEPRLPLCLVVLPQCLAGPAKAAAAHSKCECKEPGHAIATRCTCAHMCCTVAIHSIRTALGCLCEVVHDRSMPGSSGLCRSVLLCARLLCALGMMVCVCSRGCSRRKSKCPSD
jgi:hypothetical protein